VSQPPLGPRDASVDRMRLPQPVPELPVRDLQVAIRSYVKQMGFSVDWSYEDLLAGISKDDARIFLRCRPPQAGQELPGVTIWLNMASPAEVDQLHAEWKERGVLIVAELQTAPYNLREFTAQDGDGNRLRVFHDLGSPGA
jgi:hypothetical protein